MIRRLAPTILLIEGGKGGRYPYSHSLYVRDGGGILVDCGSDLETIRTLRREEGLAAILLTHYHEDHFLHLSRFPDVEVWASETDAPALESFDLFLDWYGVSGTDDEPFFRGLFAEKFPYVPRRVRRRIADGETLALGGTRAVAMVCPGHTPGHLALHFPDHDLLFMADYDLTEFGPWYGDRPGSIEAFRRSARRLAGVGAGTNVVSHEEPVHRGSVGRKVESYLAVIDRREEALRRFLGEGPRNRREIVARRIVYGPRRTGPWFDYGEWALLGKHLERMEAAGEVVREGERFALR